MCNRRGLGVLARGKSVTCAAECRHPGGQRTWSACQPLHMLQPIIKMMLFNPINVHLSPTVPLCAKQQALSPLLCHARSYGEEKHNQSVLKKKKRENKCCNSATIFNRIASCVLQEHPAHHKTRAVCEPSLQNTASGGQGQYNQNRA